MTTEQKYREIKRTIRTLEALITWIEKEYFESPVNKLWNEDDKRICQCLIEDQQKRLQDVQNDKNGHSEIVSDLKEMYRERIKWLETLYSLMNGVNAQTPTTDQGTSLTKLIDLGLPSGTLWADRNIGADAPEDNGDYFRWGETVPFMEDSEEYKFYDQGKSIAGTAHDAATVNLGKSFKMPTLEQQKELLECCKWEWTTLNGIKGMLVTGPNGNSIFFPASGFRSSGGCNLYIIGRYGYYWSASAYSSNDGHFLGFSSSTWNCESSGRADGFPVRAVAEE